MNDIVDDLRADAASQVAAILGNPALDLPPQRAFIIKWGKAANEIERLRSALAKAIIEMRDAGLDDDANEAETALTGAALPTSERQP